MQSSREESHVLHRVLIREQHHNGSGKSSAIQQERPWHIYSSLKDIQIHVRILRSYRNIVFLNHHPRSIRMAQEPTCSAPDVVFVASETG